MVRFSLNVPNNHSAKWDPEIDLLLTYFTLGDILTCFVTSLMAASLNFDRHDDLNISTEHAFLCVTTIINSHEGA